MISDQHRRLRMRFEGRRFIIRDCYTKEIKFRNRIKMEFNSINAAKSLYKYFYEDNEVYDKLTSEVVYKK